MMQYDKDGDSMLNFDEFATIFDELTDIKVTNEEISRCFELIDTNMDGYIGNSQNTLSFDC